MVQSQCLEIQCYYSETSKKHNNLMQFLERYITGEVAKQRDVLTYRHTGGTKVAAIVCHLPPLRKENHTND